MNTAQLQKENQNKQLNEDNINLLKINNFYFVTLFFVNEQTQEPLIQSEQEYLIAIQNYNMQKFNHCMDALFLRLNHRKKMHTEQPEASIFPQINISQLRNKKVKVRKTQRAEIFLYELDQIGSNTRKSIKSILLQNMKIMKNSKSGLNLLPGNFVAQINENAKSLPYFSVEYEAIFEKIADIFKQVMGVQYKDVLIAQGQLSGYNYAYFQNCFQVPYSLCCQYPLFLKIEQDKLSTKKYPTKQETIDSLFGAEINSLKTQFICRKCNKHILSLLGQVNSEGACHKISPVKLKEELKREEQRRKLSIGVMIGSGKHKSYRNSSKQQQNCSVIHRKVSPESIFIQNSNRDKIKSLRIQSTPQTVILSQPRSIANDFYPLSQL